jgi:hypothetical protein
MPTRRVTPRHAKLALLFSCAALTACGGGGGNAGDSAAPTPAPAPAAALTFAECDAKPVGLVNTYLNSTRSRREWAATTFDGEAVIARNEFDTTGAKVQARYYKEDAVAQTSTLVGREWFDATGMLTRRIKFAGNTLSTAVSAGQAQTVNYTWQVLEPSGEPDGAESLTLTYVGNETVSLRSGRTMACKSTFVLRNSGGQETSNETFYSAKGANLVKSYTLITSPTASDTGQTYLTELDTSSATLALAPATADTTPSLASCSTLPAGLNLKLTASTSTEAASALRSTAASTVLSTSTMAMTRRHVATNALQSTTHFDPAIGALLQLGTESTNGTGTIFSGIPDFRATAVGASVDYTRTATPYPSGAATTTNDRFTFVGHEKMTTPAGTFDACKARFDFAGGSSETYWFVPSRFYVRLETVSAGGVRSSREQIAF